MYADHDFFALRGGKTTCQLEMMYLFFFYILILKRNE